MNIKQVAGLKYFTENPQSNSPECVPWFVVSALVVSGHLPAVMQQDEETVAMVNTLTGVKKLLCAGLVT